MPWSADGAFNGKLHGMFYMLDDMFTAHFMNMFDDMFDGMYDDMFDGMFDDMMQEMFDEIG